MDYKDVNEQFIQRLMDAVSGSPGKTQLRVNLKTEEGSLKMPSGVFNRIGVTSEVMQRLNDLHEIQYAFSEN